MIVTQDEYRQLVQQKMQARAERHVREDQAALAEQAREAQGVRSAQALAEQKQQLQADKTRQREAAAAARRNRPALIAQYKSDPAGLRNITTLTDVCLRCGSEQVRCSSTNIPYMLVCPECSTQWTVSSCWSCTKGQLDSRDPENVRCKACGWLKCTECGACNPRGCTTNPYNTSHRQRDLAAE
jgi:hypothetical protein